LGDSGSPLTQACVCVQQFLAPRAEMARTLLLTLSALVVLSSAHATPKTDMPRGMDAVAKFFSGANHTRLERLAGRLGMTATKMKDIFEKDATLYLDSNTLDGA